MSGTCIQQMLAAIFFVLGGWALFAPVMVEALAIRPEFQHNSTLSTLLMGCFGAQAMLTGLVLNFGRLNAYGFVLFGIFGSLPFFAFNYYFYFVAQVFTSWMLLDFVGNVGILALCLAGASARKREQNTDCMACTASQLL